MPHIVIKLWPGKSIEQKNKLSDKITKAMVEELGSSENSISIDVVEIQKDDWMKNVYNKEIKPNISTLVKKPGYKSIT
ncbi:MAG: tautomerase family protein [Clostridiales bacterium]